MWLLLLVFAFWAGAAAPAHAELSAVESALGRGWTFVEAGHLTKAEAAFQEALKTREGKATAEVYYGLSVVWWERRNAMAAYMWLADAEKASGGFNWDPGPAGDWDRRIDQRRKYVEKNFTVIKLRAPKSGKSLAPLADPPPPDPLLRSFTEHLAEVVAEGVAAKVAVQWVMLPNGTYWVGDDILTLGGGQMDPSYAESWELVRDGGKARKAYQTRTAAIAAGESPARDRLAMTSEAAPQDTVAEAQAAEEEAREVREQAQREFEELERQASEDAVAREREAAELEAVRREQQERDQAEAARQASAADREAAEVERAAAAAPREARRQQAASRSADARLSAATFFLSGGGGGVVVPEAGGSASVDGVAGLELGGAIPLGQTDHSLTIGVSWNNLPVPACPQEQMRSNSGSLHVGPRFGVHLRDRLFLALRVTVHGGAGWARSSADERAGCVRVALDGGAAPHGVTYVDGGPLTSLDALGWNGWLVTLGGGLEVGLLGAPPAQQRTHLGVSFFVRHDQLLPVLAGGRTYYRTGQGEDLSLASVELAEVGSVSLARFQFGVRGTVAF